MRKRNHLRNLSRSGIVVKLGYINFVGIVTINTNYIDKTFFFIRLSIINFRFSSNNLRFVIEILIDELSENIDIHRYAYI